MKTRRNVKLNEAAESGQDEAVACIKQAMDLAEIKVDELADDLNMTVSHLQNILNGKTRYLSVYQLAIIMEACECDLYFWVTQRGEH